MSKEEDKEIVKFLEIIEKNSPTIPVEEVLRQELLISKPIEY